MKDGGGWDSLSFTSVHKSDEDLTTFYQLAIGEDESKRAEDQLLNIILLDSVRPSPPLPSRSAPLSEHSGDSVY